MRGNGIYDAAEFVAFIVPRVIQLSLGAMTNTGVIEDAMAFSVYTGLTYASAAGLLAFAWCYARLGVIEGALVINGYTVQFLVPAALLVALAAFTAVAPTTGLSLQYCATSAAKFVRFPY